eukprot:s676_g3.t1
MSFYVEVSLVPMTKRRVIVESGAEKGGALELTKVRAASRMLGSGFFQDMTGGKRDKGLRTYDHTAFTLEETTEEKTQETFWVQDELDENMLEAFAAEDDEDAAFILQFEDAISDTTQNDSEMCAFYSTYQDARKRLAEKARFRGFRAVKSEKVRTSDRVRLPVDRQPAPSPSDMPASIMTKDQMEFPECPSLFATSGTVGVVDLGTSQTVIGSEQVPEMLSQLPTWVRQQVRRCPCNLVFHCGNHQTLVSKHAMVFPLGKMSFRIAVVDGKTPFLISTTFLKGLKAVIDTDHETLYSRTLERYLQLHKSKKNLFLMDINQLWEAETLLANAQLPDANQPDMTSHEKSKTSETCARSCTPSQAVGELSHVTNMPPTPHEKYEHATECTETSQHINHMETIPENAVLEDQPNRTPAVSVNVPSDSAGPIAVIVPDQSLLNMSIAQKLKQYRAITEDQCSEERMKAIQNMTTDELEKETISFGKANIGMTFSEVFKDHRWTDWFVTTYEQSKKEGHVKYVTYVCKCLDAEIHTDALESKAQQKEFDEESLSDFVPIMETQSHIEEQMMVMHEENNNMRNRMTQIEMALQDLIKHVKALTPTD